MHIIFLCAQICLSLSTDIYVPLGSYNVTSLVSIRPSMLNTLKITFLSNIHCLSATQQGFMVFQRISFTNLINPSIKHQ